MHRKIRTLCEDVLEWFRLHERGTRRDSQTDAAKVERFRSHGETFVVMKVNAALLRESRSTHSRTASESVRLIGAHPLRVERGRSRAPPVDRGRFDATVRSKFRRSRWDLRKAWDSEHELMR